MKSLDIVNRNIEEAQEALDEATDDFRIYPCDYGTWEEIEEHYTAPYLRHYIEENKQIKQDLEVLEILRKQSRFEFNELSVEDYAKLKQWLEGNENE